MTIFILKIIAIITMFFDHVRYAFPNNVYLNNVFTQYVGRISFPLFAFMITEGYIHTSDIKKYIKRLVIFALISQIPFMLFRTFVGDYTMGNVLFTLLFGLLAIIALDKIENTLYSTFAVVICFLAGYFLDVDYGLWGISIIIIFFIFKNNKVLLSISYLIANFIYYYSLVKERLFTPIINKFSIDYIILIIPLILVFLYNGKQGRKIKYILYVFYPLHLIVLYCLHFVLA